MRKILTFLFLMLYSLNLNAFQYWELSPKDSEFIDNEKFNIYPATVISSKGSRLQVIVKGLDEKKVNVWLTLENPLTFTFGENLIIYINSLRSKEGYIEFNGDRNLIKMDWDVPIVISTSDLESITPVSNEEFIISGQPYYAFLGNVFQNDYSYGKQRYTYEGWNEDPILWQEQSVNLAINFKNESHIPSLNYHLFTEIMISSYRDHRSELNVNNNPYMKMAMKWDVGDQIIILVHKHYPGFHWIVNERLGGEALFFQGTEAVGLVPNIWDNVQ